ncbi:MAG: ribbon-helix-helix domain-containing protein [Verrucomicrobiales bacterium]
MKQITTTRIDPKTAEELEDCAKRTGLKSSDLLRVGVKMVLERARTEGARVSKISPATQKTNTPTKPKKTTDSSDLRVGRVSRKRAVKEARP